MALISSFRVYLITRSNLLVRKVETTKKEKTSVTPIRMIQYLKILKKINIAFIITGFITFTIDIVILYPDLPLGGLSFTLFIYIFALLEYINYYHTQLSYDNISDIKHLIKSKTKAILYK